MTTTVEQLQRLPIDQLDRMAFGVVQGVQLLPLDQINIRYQADYDNALDYVVASPTDYEEALDTEPVEVALESGVYWLQDGHHRYVTAQVLGHATILADLTIKDNPVKVLTRQAAVIDPYADVGSDIRDALEHAQDYFDVPFHEDVDPNLFTITPTTLTIDEVGNYDDTHAWLDAEPGELVGASRAEVLDYRDAPDVFARLQEWALANPDYWAEGLRKPKQKLKKRYRGDPDPTLQGPSDEQWDQMTMAERLDEADGYPKPTAANLRWAAKEWRRVLAERAAAGDPELLDDSWDQATAYGEWITNRMSDEDLIDTIGEENLLDSSWERDLPELIVDLSDEEALSAGDPVGDVQQTNGVWWWQSQY